MAELHNTFEKFSLFDGCGASAEKDARFMFVMHRKLLAGMLGGLLLPGAHAADSGRRLRAVIVVERHGVRAPIASEIRDSAYNAQPWPGWPATPGVLTQHGTEALRLLGAYYHNRYSTLLSGSDCAHPHIYAQANTTQRTVASANALLSGLAPGCDITVHVRPGKNNPLFNPWEGQAVSQQELQSATMGRMGDEPQWFVNAFARPLELMHDVMANCTNGICNGATPDFRTTAVHNGTPATSRDPRLENPVSLGADFAENFLLEYTEGMPMSDVGWGRVSRAQLDNLMEMNTRYHDFMLRTLYYSQIAGSDLAAHIRDTTLSVTTGAATPAELGAATDRFFLLTGHDSNLTWLGGLLHLDWLLPDQTFNATPPGSALVFEIYGASAASPATVRVFFISQTLNQIRELMPFNGSERPSIVPVYVPGCSGSAPDYACTVQDFARVVSAAVDPRFVEHTAK